MPGASCAMRRTAASRRLIVAAGYPLFEVNSIAEHDSFIDRSCLRRHSEPLCPTALLMEALPMFTLNPGSALGRSFDEYRRMFDLTEDDLNRFIIGCGDGPASFNAEACHRGKHVVSCDPLYRLEKTQIQERVAATFEQIIEQARRNTHEFVWDDGIRTVEELGRVRMSAMQAFLDDYELGKAQARYLDAELPTLPFADAAFDLALCSHFLFFVPPASSARHFIAPQCGSCAASPRKFASFRCSNSAESCPRSWLGAPRSCARRDTTCPLRRSHTNSSAAATR